jgi:hypothetical protein
VDQSRWSLETIDLEHRTRQKVWSEDTKREMEAFKKRLATDDEFYERHYGVPRDKPAPDILKRLGDLCVEEAITGIPWTVEQLLTQEKPMRDGQAAATPDKAATGRLERICSHIIEANMMADNMGERLGQVRARLLGDIPTTEVERGAARPEEVLPGVDSIDRGLEILEARLQTIQGHVNALEGL